VATVFWRRGFREGFISLFPAGIHLLENELGALAWVLTGAIPDDRPFWIAQAAGRIRRHSGLVSGEL